MTKTTLKVEGMTCNHCVMAVTNALEELEGVVRAEVSLEEGKAEVQHDDGRPDFAAMQAAVDEAGYTASTLA